MTKIPAPSGSDHWLVSEAKRLVQRRADDQHAKLLALFHHAALGILDDTRGLTVIMQRLRVLRDGYNAAAVILEAGQAELELDDDQAQQDAMDHWH